MYIANMYEHSGDLMLYVRLIFSVVLMSHKRSVHYIPRNCQHVQRSMMDDIDDLRIGF